MVQFSPNFLHANQCREGEKAGCSLSLHLFPEALQTSPSSRWRDVPWLTSRLPPSSPVTQTLLCDEGLATKSEHTAQPHLFPLSIPMSCCPTGGTVTRRKQCHASQEMCVDKAYSLPQLLHFLASEPAATLESPRHGCAGEQNTARSASRGSPGRPQSPSAYPVEVLPSAVRDLGSGSAVHKWGTLGSNLTSVPQFSRVSSGETTVPTSFG